MKDWQIAGTVEIGSLHARYVATIDHHRAADLPTLFTESGVLASVITGRSTPKSELRAYLEDVIQSRKEAAWPNIRHFHTPPVINFVDEDRATSECYFAAFNAQSIDHWGVYGDVLERVDGNWLFARRSVEILGATPNGWVGSGAAVLSN